MSVVDLPGLSKAAIDRDSLPDLIIATAGRMCLDLPTLRCPEFFVYYGPDLVRWSRVRGPETPEHAGFGFWNTVMDDGRWLLGLPYSRLIGDPLFSAGAFAIAEGIENPVIELYQDPFPQYLGYFGARVLPADVTGDGQDDVLVTAPSKRFFDDYLDLNGEAWLYDFSTRSSWTQYGRTHPSGSGAELSGRGELSPASADRIEIEIRGPADATFGFLCLSGHPQSLRLDPGYGGPPYLLISMPWWSAIPLTFPESGERSVTLSFDPPRLPWDLINPGDRLYLQALIHSPSSPRRLSHTNGLIATFQP